MNSRKTVSSDLRIYWQGRRKVNGKRRHAKSRLPDSRNAFTDKTRCSLVLPHSENLSEPVIDGYHGKLAAIGLQKVLLLNP